MISAATLLHPSIDITFNPASFARYVVVPLLISKIADIAAESIAGTRERSERFRVGMSIYLLVNLTGAIIYSKHSGCLSIKEALAWQAAAAAIILSRAHKSVSSGYEGSRHITRIQRAHFSEWYSPTS